jgi:glycosyltransferase involved in cell wall biosynthesis
VYRVPALIPHDVLPALAARLRHRRSAPRTSPPSRAPAATSTPRVHTRSGSGGALYRRFAMLLYFPDHFFTWGWLAAVASVGLWIRHRYDVVYTTSHPESAHLAGLALKLLGVRWVVDYRYGGPLWVKEIVGYRKSPARERLERRYQRWVLSRADAVITQSEPIRADFCRIFALNPDRVRVIPSGYDEQDFDPAKVASAPFTKQDHEVHVMHVGTMEGVSAAERRHIVDALNGLHEALRTGGRELVFHAVGSDVFGEERADAVRFEYRHHGVVVHWRLPSYLAAADGYLLSTITIVQGFVPSKLWEYLRAGGPILVAGPKDDVWTMADEADVALHLTLTDGRTPPPAALAAALVARLQTKRPLHPSVGCHSWESRAQAFQEVFRQVAGTAGATARRGEARA